MTWDINKQVTTIIFQSYRLSNKAQNWREITRRQCTSTKPLKPEKQLNILILINPLFKPKFLHYMILFVTIISKRFQINSTVNRKFNRPELYTCSNH